MNREVIDQNKRSFIRMASTLGMAATLCPLSSLMLSEEAMAAPMVPLRLHNPHTKESYEVELFSGSKFNKSGLLVCDWMMRDWRQKKVVVCDRKLYAGLYVVQRKFGVTTPIYINSGFRTKQTNSILEGAAENSKHLLAQAVDFAIPGVPVPEVSKYVKSLKIGGMGVYPTFTHMDTGSVRYWGKPV